MPIVLRKAILRKAVLTKLFLIALDSLRSVPVIAFLLLCLPLTGYASQVKVYRCDNGDGVIAYRQQACERGTQTELQVVVKPLGWVKPKVERKKPKRRSKTKTVPGKKVSARKDKHKEKCWRARKRLEKVEWRMRRGYKAGQGQKLRRQRREYEDYLREFCAS